jgi:ABC-type uncharacterized transport system permease subunit
MALILAGGLFAGLAGMILVLTAGESKWEREERQQLLSKRRWRR